MTIVYRVIYLVMAGNTVVSFEVIALHWVYITLFFPKGFSSFIFHRHTAHLLYFPRAVLAMSIIGLAILSSGSFLVLITLLWFLLPPTWGHLSWVDLWKGVMLSKCNSFLFLSLLLSVTAAFWRVASVPKSLPSMPLVESPFIWAVPHSFMSSHSFPVAQS